MLLAISLFFFSVALLTGSFRAGKVLVSAQFTRGFMMGLGVMMGAFAVVWVLQASHEANRKTAEGVSDAE